MIPGPAASTQPARRRTALLLALILVLGAGLRIWYAAIDPGPGKQWDERYSIDGVLAFLGTGSLAPGQIYYPSPLQTWPQALLVGASQRLHAASGRAAFEAIDSRGRFTATGYILARLVSALYGTLAILVLFQIGRRMFSPAVGLVAALVLAATPWHIRFSGFFKPDALLVLTVALAFSWALRAVDRGGRSDYALAGLGVSLAASAKAIGGLVALPLVLGSLLRGWRDRRRWARLLLAGGVAMAGFLALNPYAARYPAYLEHLQNDYAARAELRGLDRADALGALAGYPLDPYIHGPLLGALAIAGLLALGLGAPRQPPLRRAQRAMLATFPPIYGIALILASPYLKANNLLPVVPFTCLAAAWLLVTGASWVGRRAPALRSRSAVAVAGGALATALAFPGTVYVYRSSTPTTFEVGLRFLASGEGTDFGRVVLSEESAPASPREEDAKTRNLALHVVERLDTVALARLDLADGELFPESRLEEATAGFYRARLERSESQEVRILRPAPFVRRGPALVAIRHRHSAAPGWPQLVLRPCSPSAGSCVAAILPPEVGDGEAVSLVVGVLDAAVGALGAAPSVTVGERRIPLLALRRVGRRVLMVTERFELGTPGAEMRLEAATAGSLPALELTVCRWRPEDRRRSPDQLPPAGAVGGSGCIP